VTEALLEIDNLVTQAGVLGRQLLNLATRRQNARNHMFHSRLEVT
jgi:hypothetical protein